MNRRMMEILACPMDKHFPLEAFEVRADEGAIEEGSLYCPECGRFYPIIEEIPIMLPDELRDKKQDMEFLERNSGSLPEKIIKDAKPWHL